MIISSKGRYALRVMVYLAVHHSDEYIPLKEISDKEELSKKYLETITRMLSKANLIEAASGHGGGYRLTRKPEDYSVGEILKLTEGTLAPVACLMDDAEDCPRANQCRTLPMWKKFDSLVHDFFYNITLEQILEDPKFLPEE